MGRILPYGKRTSSQSDGRQRACYSAYRQHVHSGKPAKPIVDILGGLQRLAAVEPFVDDLGRIGYEDRGNGDEPGRRYFVKGAAEKRTHHLNFCELNGIFWRRHVGFRDYLEKHPDAAKQYSALKQALAAKFPNDRPAYTRGKEAFVHFILKLAANEGNS